MNYRRTAVALLAVAGLALSGCSTAADAEDATPTTKELTKLSVTMAGINLPMVSMKLAKETGEFEAHGLDVSIEVVPTGDALVLLATGKTDALIGGVSAGMLNAVATGTEIKIVAPGNIPSPKVGTGVYVSTALLDGRKFDPSMLKGQKIASTQGNAGVSMLAIKQLLEEGGLKASDVEIVTMATNDQVIALENGAIFAGIISEPAHLPLLESGGAVKVAPAITKDWPNTVYVFGPSLLNDNPEAGEAFVAAIRATYEKYMQGDYVNDPETADMLVEILEVPLDALQQNTSDLYPTELSFPSNYIGEIESTWRLWPEILQTDKKFKESDLIDTRFMKYANAQ